MFGFGIYFHGCTGLLSPMSKSIAKLISYGKLVPFVLSLSLSLI